MALAPARPACYVKGMDLNLDINIPRLRGRATRPVDAEVVRPLTEADIAMLGTEMGAKPPALKRLSDRHHALARALASGMSESDAALIVGISGSRVSILKADPTFQELVRFYRSGVQEQFRDLHARLAGLSMDAADELQERLEETPESISTGQLMDIVKLGADRTGHGPSSTQVNVNVNLAERLRAARERVERARTIEGKANEPTRTD